MSMKDSVIQRETTYLASSGEGLWERWWWGERGREEEKKRR
jgi:hypothetical protein